MSIYDKVKAATAGPIVITVALWAAEYFKWEADPKLAGILSAVGAFLFGFLTREKTGKKLWMQGHGRTDTPLT